jgi:hypothetical protein
MSNRNNRDSSANTPASPVLRAPESGPAPVPTASEVEAVEALHTEAESLAGAGDRSEPLPPAEMPAITVPLSQLIKEAWEARRTFHAARLRAEDKTARAQELERLCAERKAKLEKEETRLRERERDILEKSASLTERETNAAAGFLTERRSMVAALEKQIAELSAEREAGLVAMEERQSKDTAERRARQEARDAAWRKDDEDRSRALDGERRQRDEAFARETETRRAELNADLSAARSRAEAARREQETEHQARIAARETELSAREAKVEAETKAQRRLKADLEADREVLDEDRRAIETKVERLAATRVQDLENDLSDTRTLLERAKATRDQKAKEIESYREIERSFRGERPEQILDRITQLEREREELKARLAASLGEDSQRRLADLERERSSWLEQESVLRAQLAESDARLGRKRIAAIELGTLGAEKEALKAHSKLLEVKLQDLQTDVDKYTRADEKRDPMEALSAIDRDEKWQVERRTQPPVGGATPTLKAFAADLRQRIARGVPDRTLYYADRDVRCFLGGLAMSRLLLLQGISGTGKTSLPLAFAGATGAEPAVIEVQAGWRDRQDLVGYFNAFDRRYYATNFLSALYRAGTPACRDRLCLIILDEINLSRVEQFFADFLSALEQPQQLRQLTLLGEPLKLPPMLMREGRHLPIPPNVWFVGTANHDETTTEFADKTYDRAHVMELPRRDPAHDGFTIEPRTARDPISYEGLTKAFDAAMKARAADTKDALDWLRTKNGIAGLLDKNFRLGWGNRLERDVERFVPVVVDAGGSVGEALDHLLETKLLRKLRDRHDVRTKPLEDLREQLAKTWLDPSVGPERCLRLIDRELRAKHDEAAD